MHEVGLKRRAVRRGQIYERHDEDGLLRMMVIGYLRNRIDPSFDAVQCQVLSSDSNVYGPTGALWTFYIEDIVSTWKLVSDA